MQEKNVQGKKKQEKKVQGNRSQENRIQGKRVQEGKKQGSPKRENKRPESRAVKGVKPEQKQRSEQKQRTEQKQKAAKFGKPVLKQQSGQNVEKGKKNAKKSMCPVMRQCGGCQMLDMPYAEQLKTKRKRLETLLKGICPVKDMIGMEDPFYYRNKVHAVFDRDRRGNIISGIYQENTHNVVPVEKCMIEDQKADEIIGTIRGMLKSFKIRTFDEDTGYGLLRHVLIRRGFESGEIMVVLVTASPVFPSKNNFVKALREKHPEITTIVQNINGRGTSMVLGEKEHVLYGKGYIVDTLCGCSFRISSRSFYQVNPVQTEKLYTKALELAGLTGKETVVDAYCGIGTIGIIASKKAQNVIGVELNQDAVRDAINNAKMNQISNIRFFCNDAGRFLVNMAEAGEKADVVIMDPPRSGSTEEFMDSIAKMGAKKVVYVSCNPETLARDLVYMKKLGYKAKEAVGFDMFPATEHVETVVLLSHKKPDGHINVKVEFGEGEGKVPLDNIAKRAEEYKPKERVTYKMIKEYIEAKYGFKVHTAYIAEVKRDLGLPMYDAPNAVEELKQPRKHPTAEKVEAIKDALRYFEIMEEI